MALSEETQARLKTIMLRALEKAEGEMDDGDYEEAHWLMEIARDADHICRKHWWLEHHKEE